MHLDAASVSPPASPGHISSYPAYVVKDIAENFPERQLASFFSFHPHFVIYEEIDDQKGEAEHVFSIRMPLSIIDA